MLAHVFLILVCFSTSLIAMPEDETRVVIPRWVIPSSDSDSEPESKSPSSISSGSEISSYSSSYSSSDSDSEEEDSNHRFLRDISYGGSLCEELLEEGVYVGLLDSRLEGYDKKKTVESLITGLREGDTSAVIAYLYLLTEQKLSWDPDRFESMRKYLDTRGGKFMYVTKPYGNYFRQMAIIRGLLPEDVQAFIAAHFVWTHYLPLSFQFNSLAFRVYGLLLGLLKLCEEDSMTVEYFESDTVRHIFVLSYMLMEAKTLIPNDMLDKLTTTFDNVRVKLGNFCGVSRVNGFSSFIKERVQVWMKKESSMMGKQEIRLDKVPSKSALRKKQSKTRKKVSWESSLEEEYLDAIPGDSSDSQSQQKASLLSPFQRSMWGQFIRSFESDGSYSDVLTQIYRHQHGILGNAVYRVEISFHLLLERGGLLNSAGLSEALTNAIKLTNSSKALRNDPNYKQDYTEVEQQFFSEAFKRF